VQSRSVKGQDSVKLYERASNLRKDAAHTSIEIDKVNAVLLPLHQDLAMVKSQRDIVARVVGQLQEQEKVVDQQFAAVTQQIQAQSQMQQHILGSAGVEAPPNSSAATTTPSVKIPETIAAKSAVLTRITEELDKERTEAAELLRSAVTHFTDAANAANDLERQLSAHQGQITKELPEKEAWEAMKHIYSTSTYWLQKALAQQTLAMAQTHRVGELQRRARIAQALKPILEQAGLQMPQGLADSKLNQQITEAKTDAEEQFTGALDMYDQVAQAPLASPAQKLSGRIGTISAKYAKWLSQGSDASKGPPKELRNEVAELIKEENVSFGSFAPELLPAPPPPATAPAKPPTPAKPAPVARVAAPSGSPADPGTVAEIKQQVMTIVADLKANKPIDVKNLIIATPEQQPVVDTGAAILAGAQHINRAVAAKFGDEALKAMEGNNGGVPTPEKISAELDKAKFMSAGPDTVSLAPPGGAPMPAVPAVRNNSSSKKSARSGRSISPAWPKTRRWPR
jgi:hypothetical protein